MNFCRLLDLRLPLLSNFFYFLISWHFWIVIFLISCSYCYIGNWSQSSRYWTLQRTKTINKYDRLTEHKQNIIKDISNQEKIQILSINCGTKNELSKTCSQSTLYHWDFIWLVARKQNKTNENKKKKKVDVWNDWNCRQIAFLNYRN